MSSAVYETTRWTDKQRKFVNEYVVDLNATQAAIRAGYSEDTARSIASDLLTKADIKDAVQEAMDLRAERTRITADRVLAETALLGFSNVADLFTADGQLKSIASLPRSVAAGITSIEVVTKRIPGSDPVEVEHISKIKMADKKASLELLGKHLKLFSDKIEVTGKDGAPLVPELSDLEIARRVAFMFAEAKRALETKSDTDR